MRTFDYETLKNRVWDTETVTLVAKIHEHKGRQQLFLHQQPQALETLIELAKIQSTEASNKIEGIVTTNSRLKQLYNEKTTPKTRDEQEIMGYRSVLNTIHENYEFIPIRAAFILQLHRDLYQFSDKSIGGQFKATQNVISEAHADGTQRVIFTPLEPFETPPAIEAICESFNKAIESPLIEPLLLIPMFINDFLCIHPFTDGNGRMSRLLTTLLLYRAGYMVGRYISLESKIEKTKEEYYSVLEQCGQGWHENQNNPLPFVKYLLALILSSYREFEERISLIEQKSPAQELVKTVVKQKLGKFTKIAVMETLPHLSKASVENSLKALVQEGVLARHGNGKATFYTHADAVQRPTPPANQQTSNADWLNWSDA